MYALLYGDDYGGLLAQACREGNADGVKFEVDLERCVRASAVIKGGETPLVMASTEGHADVVQLLLACLDT